MHTCSMCVHVLAYTYPLGFGVFRMIKSEMRKNKKKKIGLFFGTVWAMKKTGSVNKSIFTLYFTAIKHTLQKNAMLPCGGRFDNTRTCCGLPWRHKRTDGPCEAASRDAACQERGWRDPSTPRRSCWHGRNPREPRGTRHKLAHCSRRRRLVCGLVCLEYFLALFFTA